jgi:hypothetical protein
MTTDTDTAPTFAITSDVQFAQPAPVERKARAKRTTHTSAGAMPLDEAPKDGTRLWLEMGDGTQIDAFWCKSRRFSCNQWSDASWWAYWGTRTPVADNIVGWHQYDQ